MKNWLWVEDMEWLQAEVIDSMFTYAKNVTIPNSSSKNEPHGFKLTRCGKVVAESKELRAMEETSTLDICVQKGY